MEETTAKLSGSSRTQNSTVQLDTENSGFLCVFLTPRVTWEFTSRLKYLSELSLFKLCTIASTDFEIGGDRDKERECLEGGVSARTPCHCREGPIHSWRGQDDHFSRFYCMRLSHFPPCARAPLVA